MCSLTGSFPLSSPTDNGYYDAMTPPCGDPHHPTPTKTDTNTGDTKLSKPNPPASPADGPGPWKKSTLLVQYTLTLGAWSMGSRTRVYKFNNCGRSMAYTYEFSKRRRPGFSHYKTTPQQAAESLYELMDEAVKVVPKSLWKRTPVIVKVPAGLGVFGKKYRREILDEVANRLRDMYESNLRSNDDVAITDWKHEGAFARITASYLLHTIGNLTIPPETNGSLRIKPCFQGRRAQARHHV